MIIAAKNLEQRIPQKQQAILAQLRADIIEGRIPLGGRLPTHVELADRFDVSNVTIQRALDRLMHEGFIVTQGRRGTFATDRPPHTSRYGLLFPTSAATDERWGWSRFWNLLVQEASGAKATMGREVAVYFDVNERGNSEDYRRLVDDLDSHRLAGLIYVAPHATGAAALPAAERLPRVGVGSDGAREGVDAVVFEEVPARALSLLASRGRERLAVVTAGNPNGDFTGAWIELAQRHGMQTRPEWVHGVSANFSPWARNLARLLFSTEGERPDALFVADDNLVEAVTQGLVDAGVRVPTELEVVAHCNYPWITPSMVTAHRIGYDVRELLQRCIGVIDARRMGGAVERAAIVPRFSNEISAPGFRGVAAGAAVHAMGEYR